MTNLEILAVISSALCTWLSIKRNMLTWPVGMLGIGAYFYLYYEARLYADMGLQVLYLGQSIYGWLFWKQLQDQDGNETVYQLSAQSLLLTLVVMFVFALGLGYFLDQFTDAELPYPDAFVAAISLTANLLLALKVYQTWYFWIVADICLAALLYYKGLYLSAGLYVGFTGMAFWGLWQWSSANDER